MNFYSINQHSCKMNYWPILFFVNYVGYIQYYLLLPFVASKISLAISSECETYHAWLALIEIVVVFICFANWRWASGGIMRSLSEISYRVGSCFQAGGPDFSPKIDALNGFCAVAMISASFTSTSLANRSWNISELMYASPSLSKTKNPCGKSLASTNVESDWPSSGAKAAI